MAYQQPTQSRYGHCDSYFVDSHDDGIYAIRAEARERARAIARMQQRALAEELSRQTSEEYQEDVMEHMEYMEVNSPDFSSAFRAANLLIVSDPTRCQFYRHPNGDSMVHAPISPRLPRGSSRCIPTPS